LKGLVKLAFGAGEMKRAITTIGGGFALTRLVGQISPADGALVTTPELLATLAGPADPWYKTEFIIGMHDA
jgi:hypothetical protein